jgi:3-hydroxybutyryl-CoA dehydrogenase
MSAPRTVGVVGAGTMGAGIAQLAAQSGIATVLHDPVPGALERGVARIERAWSRRPAEGARERLRPAGALEELEGCELIVEAAPERLELKGELLRELAARTDAVLATNTSSIPVTAVGAAAGCAERVVGMHFFNPPPVMRLLEVVAGVDTAPEAVALARGAGEAMGRHVIEVADGIGFLVNRCNRPFGLEALRIVQEGIATPEEVDRICRLGGGFRMGPFELMDLVGLDIGLEIACSFFEQSFQEPRWRPSPLQRRMVDAGRLGRKSGRGWYVYADGRPHRPDDEPAPDPGGGDGPVTIGGEGPVADELRARAQQAGWDVTAAPGELHLRLGDRRARWSGVVPLRLLELAGPRDEAVERFAATCGLHHAWMREAPGLVLARLVACLVNEAAFAISEGVGRARDVDEGMVFGLNHPRGPLAWADAIGVGHVAAIVEGLAAGTGTDRYGLAPLLRRLRDDDMAFADLTS